MKLRMIVTIVVVLLFAVTQPLLKAQVAPVCDSGGVCGTDPNSSTDPSYAGLLAARPQVENARGTQNPTIAIAGTPGTVPIIIGSQSYNKAIPILSLPGRGLDLNLTLYYNSRIWNLDVPNSTISLNTDRDFPSYGFRLDFGFMESDTLNRQFILTESDGSKHAMKVSPTNVVIFDSNDGAFIEFNKQSLILVYRNGTTVQYQAFPSQATLFRPIQIKDRNGNFISITYVSGTGNDQHIDTVTDTLGRVIRFVYDSNHHLHQITQAVSTSTDPSGTHVWATFNWDQIALNYNFSGLSVLSTPPSGTPIPVLTSCIYPNQTGYKFSYGAWGIVNHIDRLSSNGMPRSYESYNYPDASQPLSDAPRYTAMTISPDGTSTSQWLYSVQQPSLGKVTSETITDPLGTKTITALNANGTLKSQQTIDKAGKVFRTVGYNWNTGAIPLIGSITTTDDAGNQSSVSFGYDAFGNLADLGETDFGGQAVRHTVTTYMGAPYSTNHIFNLPQSVQVKDGSNAVRQRTDFNYDQTAPVALGAVVHNDSGISTPRGNLTSVTRYSDAATPGGPVTRNFTYDSTGNLTVAEVDCCNKKRSNFDPASNYAYLSSVVLGPDSGQQFTSSFSFNPDNGRLLSSTDENNQQTSYQYDSMYRVRQVTLPPSNGAAVTQSVDYADDVQAPTVKASGSANNAVVIQTFDGLGHLTRQELKDSTSGNIVNTTQFQYDEIWRRKATSNPYAPGEALLLNTVAYDALNRVISVAPPSAGSTSFDFNGNTVTITDPAGKQRKNYMDGLGRLVRVDEPGWGDALVARDSVAVSATAPNGNDRFKTIITRQKCPVGEIDCQPVTTTTVYDTGNVSIKINGVPYSYTYGQNDTPATVAGGLRDAINKDSARVVNASLSGSTINLAAISPGKGGNNISVSASSLTSDSTDFVSGSTSFPVNVSTATLMNGEDALSPANAVLTATRHLTTTYGYDALDQLRSVSQGAIGPINGQQLAGQPRSYAYDDLGRLTSSTTPESGTVTSYYTRANGTACSGNPSHVCRVVDARGITSALSYDDPFSRVTGISYSDGGPSITLAYDSGGQAAFALGRLTQITENGNSQTFAYDSLGRIGSLTHTIDGTNYHVGYGYNAANQISSITYPSNRVINHAYDTVGRLQQIADPNNQASPFLQINGADHDGAGNVTRLVLGNGINGVFSYNDHLQLATLRYFNPSASSGAADLLNLTYDYTSVAQVNNNGQIQAMHYYTSPGVEDTTKSESFSYDAWSRLSAAQTLAVSSSTPGTWSLQWGYDRLGNRLSQAAVGGNVSVTQPSFTVDPSTNRINGFTYDAAGNLTNDGAGSYNYDGANRVTSVNNSAAIYTYLGPLRIKKVNGGTTTVYVYSGNQPLAEYVNGGLSKEYVYAGSKLLATVAGSGITYHHPDHLSNRAETDATGNVVRLYGHFPYGETWYETGTPDKRKFTSYERDSETGETGMDYAIARFYSSSSGRFTSADPLSGNVASPRSLNRYSYALGDPVNLADPTGAWVGDPTVYCTAGDGPGDVHYCAGGSPGLCDGQPCFNTNLLVEGGLGDPCPPSCPGYFVDPDTGEFVKNENGSLANATPVEDGHMFINGVRWGYACVSTWDSFSRQTSAECYYGPDGLSYDDATEWKCARIGCNIFNCPDANGRDVCAGIHQEGYGVFDDAAKEFVDTEVGWHKAIYSLATTTCAAAKVVGRVPASVCGGYALGMTIAAEPVVFAGSVLSGWGAFWHRLLNGPPK